MRALEALSDKALYPLILATNVAGTPAARMAPRYWCYFADVIAVEVTRRPALIERFGLSGDVATDEPPFPQDLDAAELEHGATALLAIAGYDAAHKDATQEDLARAEALRQIARGLLEVLRDRALSAKPGN